MGKKKGKRVDLEKKAALAAKKEAKAEKATRKRLNKEARRQEGGGGGSDDGDDDSDNEGNDNEDRNMDRLLQMYKQQDAADSANKTCKVVKIDGFPLARANATLTVASDTSKKKKEAYLFGGEYFDGASNVVSDQLFRLDLQSLTWRQIVACSSTKPPPRCAHSTVYYNRCLYVFGGELATVSEYHHYKDVWKFDTIKLVWTEIPRDTSGSAPSARSGHAATVWKHFMIVFGGFYETPSRGDQAPPRWYNDVTILNLQTETWLDIPHSKLSSVLRPEPRSACNTALVGDTQEDWLVHGGFSKLPTRAKQQQQLEATESGLPVSETKVHTDAWILHLKPLLDGKPPTWERWTSSLASRAKQAEAAAFGANGRSGVGSASYNKNVLLFGGVVDQELHHHKVDSVFYNDLSMFSVEKRKFIPIRINRNPNVTETKTTVTSTSTKNETEDDDDDSKKVDNAIIDELLDDSDEADQNKNPASGWDLDKLRSNMFAFVDGEGNTVYEKIVKDNDKKRDDDSSGEEKEEESKEEEKRPSSSMSKRHHGELTPELIIERTEPLPRIKSCLFMHGNTLYIYGGLLEVGDREVTLDDMWRIDLRKKRYWECVFAGTMHKQVWRGAVHDDDNSYYSSKGGEEDLDGALTDTDNEEEKVDDAAIKKEKISSGSLKKEMADLVERHGLEDANRTSQPGETLADFYARTSEYWNAKAATQKTIESEDTQSAKDLKREGFGLARARFEELQPVIERLMDLKLQRKEQKESKSKSSKSKKSGTNSPEK